MINFISEYIITKLQLQYEKAFTKSMRMKEHRNQVVRCGCFEKLLSKYFYKMFFT